MLFLSQTMVFATILHIVLFEKTACDYELQYVQKWRNIFFWEKAKFFLKNNLSKLHNNCKIFGKGTEKGGCEYDSIFGAHWLLTNLVSELNSIGKIPIWYKLFLEAGSIPCTNLYLKNLYELSWGWIQNQLKLSANGNAETNPGIEYLN